MPKLPIISGIKAVKAFNKAGWVVARQTGSHMIMVKKSSIVTLSVPKHEKLHYYYCFYYYLIWAVKVV